MNKAWSAPLKWKIVGLGVVINLVLVASTYFALNLMAEYLYAILMVASICVLLVSTWAAARISKTIESFAIKLTKSSEELSDAATKISVGSTQLSEAVTEQSSSLQETTATVDEISSMIQKNAEAAQKSKELSDQSKNTAEQGRQTVDSMLLAISDIEANNAQFSEQMKSSNQQLSEITKMIHEISNKTKVINDIVFQTKLLSFNASIEAARAGEFGKGFAVVASEIGNLAQMSGGAAKEITNMLQKSVLKVESIVQDTKVKVDSLMVNNTEKINYGSETARQCKDALDEILTSVKSMDLLVTDIATASQEQSAGVNQITKAMVQLEGVTTQNSTVAMSSSVASNQMREQTAELNKFVDGLDLYVYGSGSEKIKSVQTQSKGSSKKLDSQSQKLQVKTNKASKTTVTAGANKEKQDKKLDLSALKAKSEAVAKQKVAEKAQAFEKPKEAKIIKLNVNKKASKDGVEQVKKVDEFDKKMKNASGLDVNVPSANHPGFDEEDKD